MDATILHADLDSFYASVEQLLDPSLLGKPIAVGGGVVLAASYEAKAFGVHGGMPGRRARELCPQLIFVGGHFKEYQRLGDAAIRILDDYTPLVERISIDEAFADVAGTAHLFGPPAAVAQTVRKRVRDELGLPISVGVAPSRVSAQNASSDAAAPFMRQSRSSFASCPVWHWSSDVSSTGPGAPEPPTNPVRSTPSNWLIRKMASMPRPPPPTPIAVLRPRLLVRPPEMSDPSLKVMA